MHIGSGGAPEIFQSVLGKSPKSSSAFPLAAIPVKHTTNTSTCTNCSQLVSLHYSGMMVSVLASINEVNQRRAQLVPRWVTVSGFKPPRSTQPGHPFVGRRNEHQPKGGDALRLGSKGRYGSCVGGR